MTKIDLIFDFVIDYIFPNSLSCNYLAQLYQYFNKMELYSNNKEFIENLNHLNQALSAYGDNKNTTFTIFRDDLSARRVNIIFFSFFDFI